MRTTKIVRGLAFLAALAFALALPVSLRAQETRGRITGKVMDPNKASVPGAAVKVTDVARGTTASLTTNDEGLFQAPYLLPGTYQVVVEVSGFKRYIRDGVLVQINETIDMDIALEVGGTQETVTVVSDTPPLNTADANLGQTIDQKRVAELPLAHGDPYTLIGLSPGVTYTGSSRLDRPFEPTHIVGYAIDGTRGNRSDLTIDGAPSTATANANEIIASYVPPTDIVQEFRVQTATFDAQFGNTEGGVTSITIKSGTNDLHGTAYFWTEPGGMAANDFFGKARGQGRPSTFSNRPGFSINGPVRIPRLYDGRDKTFFLFGYEGIRDSRPRFDAGANSFVPTAAMRGGDFSGLGVTIYDPLTRVNTGTAQNPVYTGQAFANNRIPAERISPVAKAILNYYSLPKNSGLLGNIFDSQLTEKTQPYDNFTFRIDQNITANNRMFVRGSWYNRNSLYNDYLNSEATGVNFIFQSRQGVIDDVWTINPTTVLNVRYGYNRFIRHQDQEEDARGFDLTQLGFPASFNSLTPEGIRRFPRFDFPANTVLGTGFGNEFRPIDTHSYAATLNKVLEKHALKFGGELRVYREDSRFSSNDQTGQFIFDNTYTRPSSAASADVNGLQAFAAFLLGYPTTVNYVRRADYSEYSKTWGLFIQDDFRVNNRLTLNLGLRYELETPLVERNNKSVSGFDAGYTQPIEAAARARLAASPVTGVDANAFAVKGGLLFAGKDTGSGLYETPKNTFLPRFGAAYQLNDRTVIRGGFGLFAGFLGQRRGDVFQSGYTQTTTALLTQNANGVPIPFTLSTPLANTPILEPAGNSLGRQTGLGQTVSFFNQNPAVSKQARWTIGFQRELPGRIVAEAEYVGNHGYDIEIVRNINALPNSYLNTDNSRTAAMTERNTFLTGSVANPFQGLLPGTGFNNTTIARQQLLRPFPAFGDILTTNNDGKSWYHAAQMRLEKRFSKGYTVQASYTWSKWLQATEYLNAADPTPTKMISDQDVPHRLSFSALYSLPFGKNRAFLTDANWLTNAVLGGWQIQGVVQLQSGFPIAFGSYNLTSAATSGDLFYRGGEVDIPSAQRGTARWFNTSAFRSFHDWPSFLPAGVTVDSATAAQRTAAQTAANNAATPVSHLRTLPFRFSSVRRDYAKNVDLSLMKEIHVREGMKVQLRFEAINAFNEPYFPAPVVNQATSTFGAISASNQDNYARRVQMGAKFIF
ncbi:MAG TPA: TonB-dependent receptor [Pyrinomonadaceae bacterium]|nr:TonB-dependent receptor [Pyrinomonadaceae bacterium]